MHMLALVGGAFEQNTTNDAKGQVNFQVNGRADRQARSYRKNQAGKQSRVAL